MYSSIVRREHGPDDFQYLLDVFDPMCEADMEEYECIETIKIEHGASVDRLSVIILLIPLDITKTVEVKRFGVCPTSEPLVLNAIYGLLNTRFCLLKTSE